MWVELNNHKHALRASGSCDIPKQTMANNQIKPYIFDPESDQIPRTNSSSDDYSRMSLNLYLLRGLL